MEVNQRKQAWTPVFCWGSTRASRAGENAPFSRTFAFAFSTAIRNERVTCQAGDPADIEGMGRVETLDCRLNAADVTYRVYLKRARGALRRLRGSRS